MVSSADHQRWQQAHVVTALHAASRPRVAVAGATGLVGRAVLALLAGRQLPAGVPRPAAITALVRQSARSTASGPSGRMSETAATARSAQPAQPADFPAGVVAQRVDLATLGRAGVAGLPPLDWAICCLGTTIKAAGSQTAFRAVDFDAVLAFARAAKVAGASHLAVVSAMGAQAQSPVFYNRVKGEMEQALEALGLPRLVIAQPSLLLGERAALGQPGRRGEALAQRWLPHLAGWMPRSLRPIHADAVALALLRALAADGPPVIRLRSDALQALALPA